MLNLSMVENGANAAGDGSVMQVWRSGRLSSLTVCRGDPLVC